MYAGVLMRLVSITPGHVKLDWLPTPKVDRVNENDKDNKNNGKDDGNDDNESDSDSESDSESG